MNPMDPKRNWVDESAPFRKRHRDLTLGDFQFQPPAAALACTGSICAALSVHAVGMKLAGRVDGGADFEAERRWDVKHGTRRRMRSASGLRGCTTSWMRVAWSPRTSIA